VVALTIRRHRHNESEDTKYQAQHSKYRFRHFEALPRSPIANRFRYMSIQVLLRQDIRLVCFTHTRTFFQKIPNRFTGYGGYTGGRGKWANGDHNFSSDDH